MIHVRVTRSQNQLITELHLDVVGDSLKDFQLMVDKALNCWPDAPKDLKDLGDMLTHGCITQDHTVVKMNTKQNSDFYTAAEQKIINKLIDECGFDEWKKMLITGEAQKKIHLALK